MSNLKGIFVIVGNDGTGKSSIANLINQSVEGDSCYKAIERSGELATSFGINPKVTDQLTFIYQWDPNYAFSPIESVTINEKTVPVYWIVLSCHPKISEKRINGRDSRCLFETPKALFYYHRKYLEIAANFGLPVVENGTRPIEETVQEILTIPNYYHQFRSLALLKKDYQDLDHLDIEKALLKNGNIGLDKVTQNTVGIAGVFDNTVIPGLFESLDQNTRTRMDLRQWLRNLDINQLVEIQEKYLQRSFGLFLVDEGESKRIYRIISKCPIFNKYCFIALKSTIYSHSRQSTKEIPSLASVRGMGSQLYLEMMMRNGLDHSYLTINRQGIIFSKYLKKTLTEKTDQEMAEVEVVVKELFVGTDKHSFYGLDKIPQIVRSDMKYTTGPRVRYDWRNPNHVIKSNGVNPMESPYYYIIEETLGKNEFFKRYLSSNALRPYGDKMISEDLIEPIINLEESKKNVLKMFFTIQYYFSKVGLNIQDVCFMTTRDGSCFWSEINQDCMRIKNESGESFDKDIWRAGGSAAEHNILTKWCVINTLLAKYFHTKPFEMTEINKFSTYCFQTPLKKLIKKQSTLPKSQLQLYRSLIAKKTNRRIIATIDLYDGHPSLVKSGKVFETHSNGDFQKALKYISIFPDFLVVDLNKAMNQDTNVNRDLICQYAPYYYYHSGGGIRSLEDAQKVLESSVRRVVLGSNTNSEFLAKLDKERIIVELSINEDFEVLTHGREVNTKIHIKDRLFELVDQGVRVVSITFHQTEGHLQGLDRSQITKLMQMMPLKIEKVIIAGGVTSVDDLEFLWSFDRCIPQLGSAIWKNKISIGEIYCSMMHWDHFGLVPAIIQHQNGQVLGLVWMNKEAIMKTCETRLFHRYSREHSRVMLKGETSGNIMKVSKMAVDCDSDALLVTVSSEGKFCHSGNKSCFSIQSSMKANLADLMDHILTKKNGPTYSGIMQRNPGLTLSKLMEEFWEIVIAPSDTKVHECSDLLVHFIMYLNGEGISYDDIVNELNARRWNPHLLTPEPTKKKCDKYVIAVTANKYSAKTDKYIEEKMGIHLDRGDPSDRRLDIKYRITNSNKYWEIFENKQVEFVGCRPKDMVWLMALGRVHACVTYNTVIDNMPLITRLIHSVPDESLQLCLIGRKDEEVNFNTTKKINIVVEHPHSVYIYLRSKGINDSQFKMDHVIGSSESFLVSETITRYSLCDAIVETGKTLEANNLEIKEVVLDHGDVTIGWYEKCLS